MAIQLLIFAASRAARARLSERLTTVERVGTRFRFSDEVLGIVTAPGTDMPGPCSAAAMLPAGPRKVGVSVVLGSNIFNRAGLLRLSALAAGRASIGRRSSWFGAPEKNPLSLWPQRTLRFLFPGESDAAARSERSGDKFWQRLLRTRAVCWWRRRGWPARNRLAGRRPAAETDCIASAAPCRLRCTRRLPVS